MLTPEAIEQARDIPETAQFPGKFTVTSQVNAGVLSSLRSDLALDALEMAMWNRRRAGHDLDGLVHHSDLGVQYLSIRYSERLAENNIVALVGSRGDSYDNALVESFNGLYKWELIHRRGPWRGLEDVEFATIRDTRLTVGMVLGQLAGGRTIEDLLNDYPYLEAEDVFAALEFAAAAVNERELSVSRPV